MWIAFFIYDFLFLILLMVFLPYLYLKRQNREDGIIWLKERFGFISDNKLSSIHGRPIWIHAVSVGEVMASIPLISAIKERHPNRSMVLSTVTDTGHLIAMERAKDVDAIIYLPFDISPSVKGVLKRVRPEVFILIETEIWPNLLRALRRNGIPSLVINGRISRKSFKGYKRMRKLMRIVLKDISKFGMQTTSDAERIKEIGADPSRIEVIGNIKFDQPLSEVSSETERLRESYGICGKSLFVAGSTHEGEEGIILDVYKELKKDFHDLILIVAPRHIDRVREIEDMVREKGITFRRRTELIEKGRGDTHVIILDTIGELARIYSMARVVFIGGSLVRAGGHNILEPAVYSRPILFGPYMGNFEDIAQTFLENGAARQVSNGSHLKKEMEYLLRNTDEARVMGENARNIIEENKGAVKKAIRIIEGFLA